MQVVNINEIGKQRVSREHQEELSFKATSIGTTASPQVQYIKTLFCVALANSQKSMGRFMTRQK